MKSSFHNIYLCAFLVLISSQHSMAQVHPDHSNAHHSNFWSSYLLVEEHSQKKDIELKKFIAELPAQPENLIKYLVNILNDGSSRLKNIRYEIIELPASVKQAEPSYELEFVDNKLVAKIKVHPNFSRNPLYILDALLLMEHMFKEGPGTKSIHLHSYVDIPVYYHEHHKDFVYDHSKKKTIHYHEHVWNSLTGSLGVNGDMYVHHIEPLMEAELKTNATLGSVYALKELAKIQENKVTFALESYKTFFLIKDLPEEQKKNFISEMAALHNLPTDSSKSSDEMAAQYYNERKSRLHNQVQQLDRLAREQYRIERSKLADPDKKAEKDQLEKMPLKLNDMLMNNDRNGVANLLEAYLPFEVMEPIEKGIWNDWIDAIRNPQKENSVVLYRGLDSENDKVQQVDSDNGQKKIGLFSVLLTKNQGSFTRRLRSLITMRYKIMTDPYDSRPVGPLERVPLITRMMSKHAGNPIGSPVMSFSTDIRVAGQFAESGIVAVNIDKRRVLPNFLGIPREIEMLVPLVIFPDEVVAYQEGTKGHSLSSDLAKMEAFRRDVQEKIKSQRLTVLPEQDIGILKTGFEVFKNATHEGPGALCRQIFK